MQEPLDEIDESRKVQIEEALSKFWENADNLKQIMSPGEHAAIGRNIMSRIHHRSPGK